MLISLINYSLFLSLLPSLVSCQVFRMGECPEVKPMPIFNINRFLGEWYIVQKYGSGSDCVREYYMRDDDHFFITKLSKPFGSLISKIAFGEVFFTINETNSEMWIDYYQNSTRLYNPKKYVVLTTDYDNYALLWNCHKILVGHKQSAQIMARSPQMDRKMISKLRELLITYNLNVPYLTIVKQNNCELMPGEDMPLVIITCEDNYSCDHNKKEQSVNKSGIHVDIPFNYSATPPFK